ncbi:hypothetical protein [Pectobacterium aroidearum]|uniref:hypothetical protein n=1 Tax=Pectobacterium aroidearum TaxID=1201031 RepID=UPI0032ED894D
MFNEKGLILILEDVDANMAKNNIPIRHRLPRALLEVSKKLNLSISLYPNFLSNGYVDEHSKFIHEWYNNRYGDRLKYSGRLGSFYVLLKHDFWFFDVPVFFGECAFYLCQDLSDIGGGSSCNILATCKEMTQSFADLLTDAEIKSIQDVFILAVSFHISLESIKCRGLIMGDAAFADLNAANGHIISQVEHYGQAKWSYSQFIEKILKSLIHLKGVNNVRRFNHSLLELTREFNKVYSANVPLELVEEIKASANVRYDEGKVKKEEIFRIQSCVFHFINEVSASLK